MKPVISLHEPAQPHNGYGQFPDDGNGHAGAAPTGAEDNWPAPLDNAAFHGPAGRFVRLVDPHTEADPAATLVQFLVAVGNAAGRGPHFTVEADRHGTNLNVVLVGKSAKARKGTSWGRVRQVLAEGDPDWTQCIVSGLSSGEGLIHHVRDAVEKQEPIKEKGGHITGYETVITDHGVEDKRLLVIEAEFASVLKQCERSGNTLSAVLRNAWDNGNLGTLTRSNPLRATGAHISIVGHVTDDEVNRYLDTTEAANGFANRFVWLCVKRSKILPDGGSLEVHELAPIIEEVRDVLAFSNDIGEIRRDAAANEIWHRVYEKLSDGRPGLLGSMTARAEAQVMRLACLYAVLDRDRNIRPAHLKAALAIWEYCEVSVRYVFGDRMGDPAADRVHDALGAQPEGLTRTEISSLFGRNLPGPQLDRVLSYLLAHGRAMSRRECSGGRPVERWFVV